MNCLPMVLSELMNLELNKPVFSDGLENVNAVFNTEETKICLEIYFSASKRYYSSSIALNNVLALQFSHATYKHLNSGSNINMYNF